MTDFGRLTGPDMEAKTVAVFRAGQAMSLLMASERLFDAEVHRIYAKRQRYADVARELDVTRWYARKYVLQAQDRVRRGVWGPQVPGSGYVIADLVEER